MNEKDEKQLINNIVHDVLITDHMASARLIGLQEDYDILISYKLYAIMSRPQDYLIEIDQNFKKTFMGHDIYVVPDRDDYSYWFANRREV